MSNSGHRINKSESVERLSAGDSTALIEVFNKYFDRLYSLIFHSIGGNHAIAEDIIQETFLSALELVSSFKHQGEVYTWLAGIAFNKIADYYRIVEQEHRYVNLSPDDILAYSQQNVSNRLSVADEAKSNQERVTMAKALSNLSFDYRAGLFLKYIEEMPVSEIGKIMNRPSESINTMLAKAWEILREIVNTRHG